MKNNNKPFYDALTMFAITILFGATTAIITTVGMLAFFICN
jgi:hypothetical protein